MVIEIISHYADNVSLNQTIAVDKPKVFTPAFRKSKVHRQAKAEIAFGFEENYIGEFAKNRVRRSIDRRVIYDTDFKRCAPDISIYRFYERKGKLASIIIDDYCGDHTIKPN
jgi:hypothetical protein